MEMTLPGPVRQALERLEAEGYDAYVVGGCVRDAVLGRRPHDYDICTSAEPGAMQRVFQGERTIETGLKHGTLTVLLCGMPLEITTFRVDGAYLDGRHPASVRFAARVEDDLSRRDFTMNAMAYAPRAGLVDPFGGQRDCQTGLIRCVGAPEERFSEDALRMLRALRFSARFGFPIEEKTAAALRGGCGRLSLISRERIFAEMTGLLQGKNCASTLLAFPEVISAALPECASLLKSPAYPITARRVEQAGEGSEARWAAFLWDGGEDGDDAAALASRVMRGLKASVRLTDAVCALVRQKNAPLCPDTVQEMLSVLGPEKLGVFIDLRRADRIARGEMPPGEAEKEAEACVRRLRELLQENACYTLAQLAVNGGDLTRAGLKGPEIGQTLQKMLLRVVRGEAPNEKEALLAMLREN